MHLHVWISKQICGLQLVCVSKIFRFAAHTRPLFCLRVYLESVQHNDHLFLCVYPVTASVNAQQMPGGIKHKVHVSPWKLDKQLS